MKRAHFLSPADAELGAQIRYYRRKAGPGVSSRFVRAVEQTTRLALEFPDAGSPGPKDTRRLQVQGFPHSLIYRPVREGIVVFAVAHPSREPGYWLSRA